MMLSGLDNMSFILEPTAAPGRDIALRPHYLEDSIDAHWRDAVSMSGEWTWSADEVGAAAKWWRDVANDLEPEDERHVWFGGGVAFGRVHPHRSASHAIDVIVLSSPHAKRTPIEYTTSGQVSVDTHSDPGSDYITIDTNLDEIEKAAAWWEMLHRSIQESP
jgi:hypothetical protein